MTTESAHPNIKADLQQLHVGLSSPLADMAALWSASTETEGKGASRTARGQLTLTLHKDLPSGELQGQSPPMAHVPDTESQGPGQAAVMAEAGLQRAVSALPRDRSPDMELPWVVKGFLGRRFTPCRAQA